MLQIPSAGHSDRTFYSIKKRLLQRKETRFRKCRLETDIYIVPAWFQWLSDLRRGCPAWGFRTSSNQTFGEPGMYEYQIQQNTSKFYCVLSFFSSHERKCAKFVIELEGKIHSLTGKGPQFHIFFISTILFLVGFKCVLLFKSHLSFIRLVQTPCVHFLSWTAATVLPSFAWIT